MKLTFLGTKGEIEESSKTHKMHSSLLIQKDDARILIDFGETWKGRLDDVKPTHILLTHAHKDHAHGFDEPVSVPVYSRRIVFETLDDDIVQLFETKVRR